MTVKTILVVSTTGMGDSLWGTPGIRELKNSYPDSKIDLIVNKYWVDLFKHCPHLNNIFSYRNRWYSQIYLGIKLLFNPKYSHIFIFQANRDFRKMKVFLKSSSIWNHQGHKWCPEKLNIKSKLEEYSASTDKGYHAIERRLQMLKEINVEPNEPQMELFFSDSEKSCIQKLFVKNGIKKSFRCLPYRSWLGGSIVGIQEIF